jgi:hypothetical protein
MDSATAAGLAMTFNFITLAVAAIWLLAPWARRRPGIQAVIPFLWLHTGRTIALQLYSSQAAGFAISDGLRDQIVWGDQLGFALALASLLVIWLRPALARPVLWLFVIATVVDLGNALIGGVREDALAQATDISWIILTFYVPALWVSVALVAWILVRTRRSGWTTSP